MRFLAQVLVLAGGLVWIATGVYGLILDLGVLHDVAGVVALLLGLLLFPVTFVVVPWYAGLALANWEPLIVSFGGALGGAVLYAAGHLLAARGD